MFVVLFYNTQVGGQPPQPPPQQECNNVCPENPPYMPVTITTDDTYRYVTTSQCPPFFNKNWTTPGSACVNEMTYQFLLQPRYAKVPISMGEPDEVFESILYLKPDPAPILGQIGVFTNGVNVYGPASPCGAGSKCTDEGAPTDWVDAIDSEGHIVDQCAGRADGMDMYHIHAGLGIDTNQQREACNLTTDVPGEHSQLLGWMFDGFAFYGLNSLGGVPPTDLDACNGHTHEIDGVEVYHYHLTDGFPWTIGCYKGCPIASNNPIQLNSIDGDATYGCPEGLDYDPSLQAMSTPTPTPTPTPQGDLETRSTPTPSPQGGLETRSTPTLSPQNCIP